MQEIITGLGVQFLQKLKNVQLKTGSQWHSILSLFPKCERALSLTFRAILPSEAFQTNALVRPSDIVACSIVTARNEVGAR